MTARRTWLVWLATRAALVGMLYLPRVGGHILFGDAHHYRAWADGIRHWTVLPYRDFGWEYPPGAALFIVPPAFVRSLYDTVFVALMIGVDLAVFGCLRKLAARMGSDRGVWLWLAGVLLLGPLAYTRFDSAASLLVMLTAWALAAGAPYLAGLALGGGIVVKLWPALLLLVLPFRRDWRPILVTTAAMVLVAVLAVLAIGGARHGSETFSRHTDRGLQVEAIAATPVVIAQRSGADVTISFHRSSGSWDLTGSGVAGALTATRILNALALVAIGVLLVRTMRRRDLGLDLVATALLLLTVTDKVLSPQYELWLLGVFAVAISRPASPLLPAALLVGASAALTQAVYPAYYRDLVHGHGVLVVVILAIRNAVLVAATVVAVVRLWGAARTATP